VALISDAGTPCISDPGYNLVRDAVAEGIPVVPIPGACAAIAALSGSGLPSDSFTFAGFPPARQGKRRAFLADMARLPGTLVLYEAPHRLEETLRDIREVLGERQVVVARELSKIYEEFIRGSVPEVMAAVSQAAVRGEIVILIARGEAVQEQTEALDTLLQRFLDEEGLSVKDAARKAALITGGSRNEAYSEALRLRNEAEQH
jgi:16S rRNA (cytidine1402-2'-O)-methyltransferase